jgi:hypothetical protein
MRDKSVQYRLKYYPLSLRLRVDIANVAVPQDYPDLIRLPIEVHLEPFRDSDGDRHRSMFAFVTSEVVLQ